MASEAFDAEHGWNWHGNGGNHRSGGPWFRSFDVGLIAEIYHQKKVQKSGKQMKTALENVNKTKG